LTRRPSRASGGGLPWTGLDPERRNALLLYAALGALVVFVLALISIAYYNDRIAPLNDPVLRIGDREFQYAQLERRVKYDIQQGTFALSASLGDAITESLRSLEREELIRQAAAHAGVPVTEADIDDRIRQTLGLAEGIDRNRFAEFYRGAVLRSGLPVREYREMVAAAVAQDKIVQQIEAGVPEAAEQVQLHLIQVSTQAEAIAIKQRLETEPFAVIAATESIHSSRSTAGDLGWVPRGALTPDLEDVAFALPVNQMSDVVDSEDGFFILQVRDTRTGPIDEKGLDLIIGRAFNKHLRETRDHLGVTRLITESQVERVARSLLDSGSLGGG
jgi:parvulin-like peptidyl-prolyl isomerase